MIVCNVLALFKQILPLSSQEPLNKGKNGRGAQVTPVCFHNFKKIAFLEHEKVYFCVKNGIFFVNVYKKVNRKVFGKQRIEPSIPNNHRIQLLDSKIVVQQAQQRTKLT